MIPLPSPYAGARVALATRHGKERVIAAALQRGLDAELVHLSWIDTDTLGSFCGTVAREGSMAQACHAKAEWALREGGTGLAIASEGSFGPHPAVPFLAAGWECMVFLDPARGLRIEEQLLAPRTNFAHRLLPTAAHGVAAWPHDLMAWLERVGFPSHALIVRPVEECGALPPGGMRKGVRTLAELQVAINAAAAATPGGSVRIETDMRAHCNPTRMASIRRLAFRLVRRLGSACPRCGSPGWGRIGLVHGLPCGWCGQPTDQVVAEQLGCPACSHQEQRPRSDGRTTADPGYCLVCNP